MADKTEYEQGLGVKNVDTGGTYTDPDARIAELLGAVNQALYMNTGSRRFSTFQDAMFGIDSIRNTVYMPEMEGHGFTFITRPKLNLSDSSLKTDRVLSLLNTRDSQSITFALRALLDTRFTGLYNIPTSTSLFLNDSNPFIPVLSNRLLSLNGWPDPTLDVETTEGGFFSESITYPKGHDQLTRNYDISATFSDLQGSIIHILFLIWIRWIHLATRGRVSAYMEDIENRRLSFTSSIYRFVMDPSNRFITKWAKATGCFPRSVPTGAYFNYDANASNVDVAMNMSVPFTVAGKVEYMDPIILQEFNMLVDRRKSAYHLEAAHNEKRMRLNFKCMPYIDIVNGTNELKWLYDPKDVDVSKILSLTEVLS